MITDECLKNIAKQINENPEKYCFEPEFEIKKAEYKDGKVIITSINNLKAVAITRKG